MPDPPYPPAGTLTRRTFRRAPGDERRQDLIRATLDCVAETGLHAVTVREVAVRAGVTNGLIRHYFESKDRMIQEAYRATMGEMTELVKAASLVAGATARERLRRFVAANLGAPVADIRRLTLWASFISMVHVDAAMAAIHREHYLAFRKELEALVGEVFAEAKLPARKANCRRAAIKINAVIDGLWLEGTLAPEIFANKELVAMGIEAVEAILGLPPIKVRKGR
ncbi:MAG: TetR family transcriptional regulator C-terminal domain-containing protein [Acidiphilium sp.]